MAEAGTQAPPAGTSEAGAAAGAHESSHPRSGVYVGVALVLGVITLIEVGIFYAEEAVKGFAVPTLLVLSAAKFVLVAGFYMHLKFDGPLFRRLFVGGIALAVALYAAVLAMFGPVR